MNHITSHTLTTTALPTAVASLARRRECVGSIGIGSLEIGSLEIGSLEAGSFEMGVETT